MSTSVEDANVTSPFNHDGWPVAKGDKVTVVGHSCTGYDGSLIIILQTAESAFFEGERHRRPAQSGALINKARLVR